MVGLINSSSSHYCFYEIDFASFRNSSRYVGSYSVAFPMMALIQPRSSQTKVLERLEHWHSGLIEFGTKLPGFRHDLLTEGTDVIVSFRGLVQWLSQPKVRAIYQARDQVIPRAIDYVEFLSAIYSRPGDKTLVLWLEDLFERNDLSSWAQSLYNFLGIDFRDGAPVAKLDELQIRESGFPNPWLQAHPSSLQQPEELREPLTPVRGSALDEIVSLFESLKKNKRPLLPEEASFLDELRFRTVGSPQSFFEDSLPLRKLQHEEKLLEKRNSSTLGKARSWFKELLSEGKAKLLG